MNVNLRDKGILAALAVLLLAPLAGIRAQGTGGAAAAAASKIAVLSVRNAIVATAEGKQAQALLQSQFAPKQNELQSVQKQIEDRATKEGIPAAQASRELLAEKQPSLQFTTPEQLGELAVFLCSPAAENVRGQAWSVDGGWTAQ